jgi:hypothetical protein
MEAMLLQIHSRTLRTLIVGSDIVTLNQQHFGF